VAWIAFPLHPETPDQGRSLEDLFKGRDFDLAGARRYLQQEAQRLRLPFGDREMTYNSRKAQELGKWAESMGKGDAFHRATFQAYFVQGRNIALREELLSICKGIGLPTDEAAKALADPNYAQAVDGDWQRSREAGITAVPSFRVNGRLLVGAHPYGALEKLVVAAGAQKISPSGPA
jgi:predicted DsbA family dithiol-disulfide isomerase